MISLTNNKTKYTVEIIVTLGYFLFISLAIVACSGLLYISYTHQASEPEPDLYLVNLPSRTPVPHISEDYQHGVNGIFSDSFNDNRNDWRNHEDESRITVKNGNLLLESLSREKYATALSASSPFLKRPYYIQADFSTDKVTSDGFGIIFISQYKQWNESNFFLFIINPESKRYFLHHRIDGEWVLLMAGDSNKIQTFPDTNTLGIYVNKNHLEFYINQHMVNSYQGSGPSFQGGQTGFFVDRGGFELLISNFTIDGIEGE